MSLLLSAFNVTYFLAYSFIIVARVPFSVLSLLTAVDWTPESPFVDK